MGDTSAYLLYVVDQLGTFARVRSRRMFGGIGLYADELFFAIVGDDCLYFKVDDSNRPDYVSRGCDVFRPFADEPTKSLSYFAVPADVIEDADELKAWARKSMRVAAAALAKNSSPRKQGDSRQRQVATPKRIRNR